MTAKTTRGCLSRDVNITSVYSKIVQANDAVMAGKDTKFRFLLPVDEKCLIETFW